MRGSLLVGGGQEAMISCCSSSGRWCERVISSNKYESSLGFMTFFLCGQRWRCDVIVLRQQSGVDERLDH